MKNLCLLIIIIVWFGPSYTQSNVDNYLSLVSRNNKSIIANQKYWETKGAEYSTGLTLYDPQMEYDYLFGYPSGAGNQRDFALTQRIDFPSVYSRKRALSKQQINRAVMEQRVFRQEIMLKAKLLCLEMILHNKKQKEIEHRFHDIAALSKTFENRVEKGDATITDLNKIKLKLLEVKHSLAVSQMEIANLQTRMDDLNGGQAFSFADAVYPAESFVPDFEILDSTIEANDPIIAVYDQERRIAEMQIRVQKAMQMPGVEIGYHSQTILGQSYRGAHAGITVPLWENRNKLKATKFALEYTKANTDRHREEHKCENKELYNQLTTHRLLLNEYVSLFESMNNKSLLDKSLNLGQITVVDYLAEEQFSFDSYIKYLGVELEYHKALAILFKFSL